MPGKHRPIRQLAAIFVVLGAFLDAAGAQTPPPRLHTHQAYMEEVTRATTLDVGN